MSHPLCQDWRITKTNDYDDQRTNGTGARQSQSVQLGQAAATAVEPRELVVSTDARGGGSRRGLATGPPCPSRADLFSGVRCRGSRGSLPRGEIKGIEAGPRLPLLFVVPRSRGRGVVAC